MSTIIINRQLPTEDSVMFCFISLYPLVFLFCSYLILFIPIHHHSYYSFMFTVIFWNPFSLDNHFFFLIKHQDISQYRRHSFERMSRFNGTYNNYRPGHISRRSRASMPQIPNLAQFVFIQRQLSALEMCWTLFIETEICRAGMPLQSAGVRNPVYCPLWTRA